jgi:hypothetical protein
LTPEHLAERREKLDAWLREVGFDIERHAMRSWAEARGSDGRVQEAFVICPVERWGELDALGRAEAMARFPHAVISWGPPRRASSSPGNPSRTSSPGRPGSR